MIFDEALSEARLLVVDDEEMNIRIVTASLKKAGCFNVSSLTNPNDVIEWCRNNVVDLILLDLNMPQLHGLELMAQMQRELPEAPQVVVLTAITSVEDKLQALELGALDYLTKPFDVNELLLRVRNGLRLVALSAQLKSERDNLHQEVKLQTQELENTQNEVLYRLGRAAEYRDNETGAHVVRMSKSCGALALAATGDKAFASQVQQASQMHDVGKIGIPDGVLLKQGKLNDREWDIMRSHARIGYEILSDTDTPLMHMAAQIALTHHERWDGKGYPNGLRGNDIPLESRIVALCDVYDALRSERPYKQPWSKEDTSKLIGEEAGSHFDPELTEAFLKIVDQVEEIREQHPDELPNGESRLESLLHY
jgi:putative two-component system response regulator